MIKRYECLTGHKHHEATVTDDGPWVSHDDHAEAMQKLWQTADTRERMNSETIATLRAENDRLRGVIGEQNDGLEQYSGALASVHEKCEDAERERDTLRADVERWVKEVAHLKLAAEKAERDEES